MKKVNLFFYSYFIFFLLGCQVNPICELKAITKIWIIMDESSGCLNYPPLPVTYQHELLIQNFELECADSITIMHTIEKYLSNTDKKPLSNLRIFYSSKYPYYIDSEDEANNRGVIWIFYNKRTGKEKSFNFYDREGNLVYSGSQWQNLPIEFNAEERNNKRKAVLKMLRKGAFTSTIRERLVISTDSLFQIRKEENIWNDEDFECD